jgi:hypothetical protein
MLCSPQLEQLHVGLLGFNYPQDLPNLLHFVVATQYQQVNPHRQNQLNSWLTSQRVFGSGSMGMQKRTGEGSIGE